MARDNELRDTQSESPATTGRSAFLQSVSPVHIAAILAILAAAPVAVWQLAGVGGNRKVPPQPRLLTTALGAPQRSAPLVRKPASTEHVTIKPHAFADPNDLGDSRLLSIAMLTVAGVNIAPAGLGWRLKKTGSSSKVELRLGGSTLPAPYANDPAIGASAVTANETAGSRTVLDLSRPIRAGPGNAQAIDSRVAASSDPDSRRHLDGV